MKKIQSDNLVDLVYQRIKEMILNGMIKPGDKMNKMELSEQLGVSITPINEVINRLTGEKFIEKRGRKGYFVKELTLKDLTEFFTVRAGLEGMAIKLCIEDLPENELVEFKDFFTGYKLPLNQEEMKKYINSNGRISI